MGRVRSYIRLFTDTLEETAEVTDGEFRAWVTLQLRAHRYADQGTYPTRDFARSLLPQRLQRHVQALISRGLLTETASGGVYLAGWSEAQEGDLTVAERQRRRRQSDATEHESAAIGVTPVTNNGVTPVTNESVTPLHGRRQRAEGSSRGQDPLGNGQAFTPKQAAALRRMAAEHDGDPSWLDRTLSQAADEPDPYRTVVEAHHRWRDRAVGEAPVPIHDGRHGSHCVVCRPLAIGAAR